MVLGNFSKYWCTFEWEKYKLGSKSWSWLTDAKNAIKNFSKKKKKMYQKFEMLLEGISLLPCPFLSEFLTLFMVSLDFAWLYVWMTPGALSNNNTTTAAAIAIAVGLSRMKVTDVVHAWQRSIYHIFIRNRDACDPSTMAPSSLKTSTEWSFFCIPSTVHTYRRSKGRGGTMC